MQYRNTDRYRMTRFRKVPKYRNWKPVYKYRMPIPPVSKKYRIPARIPIPNKHTRANNFDTIVFLSSCGLQILSRILRRMKILIEYLSMSLSSNKQVNSFIFLPYPLNHPLLNGPNFNRLPSTPGSNYISVEASRRDRHFWNHLLISIFTLAFP